MSAASAVSFFFLLKPRTILTKRGKSLRYRVDSLVGGRVLGMHETFERYPSLNLSHSSGCKYVSSYSRHAFRRNFRLHTDSAVLGTALQSDQVPMHSLKCMERKSIHTRT